MSWLASLREAIRRCLVVLRSFVASVQFDSTVNDEDCPPEERWWNPETRPARADEEASIRRHCTEILGRSTIKVCPNCGVVLHAARYEHTEGGNAYATDGRETWRHRTYWRSSSDHRSRTQIPERDSASPSELHRDNSNESMMVPSSSKDSDIANKGDIDEEPSDSGVHSRQQLV